MSNHTSFEDWLSELEKDRGLTIQQFYAVLLDAQDRLETRLACADSDGLDLNDLGADGERRA